MRFEGPSLTRSGRSHSTRPITKRPPPWCNYSPEEVEALVIKLTKDGNPAGMVGIILRDQHGIPLVKPIVGKTITQILKEANLAPSIPEDISRLVAKATRLRRHLTKNKSDATNRRGLEMIESKIRHLAKYYQNRGILEGWEYKPEALA